MVATSSGPTREQARVILDRARRDPVWFALNVLGKTLWSTQGAILTALAQARARVAAKACHSSGKTFTGSLAVLWFLCCGGIVVSTAPTWTQVEKLIWSEIHKAYASALFPIGGTLLKTGLSFGPDIYAMGMSTNEGVRFQGWHGTILIILDEANGIAADIFEAIEGIRAGGDVRVLMIGNPVVSQGPFYDAFATGRGGWTLITIDAFDTPNLRGLTPETLRLLSDAELDRNEAPHLTSRRWVYEKLLEWGEDSPLWQSRVRGQFPKQAPDALIAIADLDAAAARTPVDDGGQVVAGLDVAGGGSAESVLTVRRRASILAQHVWTVEHVGGEVLAALRPYRGRLEAVNLDATGVGHNLVPQLRDELGDGVAVVPVNVGERASDPERFANLKAELYWGLRDWFREEPVAGLTDDTTFSQLAGIRWRLNSRGKIEIESKKELKRRGQPSPDRAESVMLAFADVEASAAGVDSVVQGPDGRPVREPEVKDHDRRFR